MDNTANCGNISAAVGPFAIDEGLVEAREPETVVRVYNTNTNKIIEEHIQVKDGSVMIEGDARIEGVPGTGSPIDVFFVDPAGSKTGKLFPPENKKETLEVPGFGALEATIIDCANPVVFLTAAALESRAPNSLNSIKTKKLYGVLKRYGPCRGKARFCGKLADACTKSTSIPKVGIVSAPQDYADMDGQTQTRRHGSLHTRGFFGPYP